MSLTNDVHHDTYPLIDPRKVDFSGKYVFISGASKGIGRAMAIAFARAGASGIALGARSDFRGLEDELLKAARDAGRREGPRVVETVLDVTDASSAEAAARETRAVFPRLDVLINNAGYIDSWAKVGEGEAGEWWRTWEVNVKGTYNLTRAMIPLLLAGGDRTVVNVTSLGAFFVLPGASAYQTSKLAVSRFSEFISNDYAEEGIVCYSYHPGGVPTEMAEKVNDENVRALIVDTPELAADTAVFLSAERRDWLAGRFVSCNWDMAQFLAKKEEIVRDDLLKIRLAI